MSAWRSGVLTQKMKLSVSVKQSRIVTVTRQQLFVVGAVHNEFAQFKYREADCKWTVHHYAGRVDSTRTRSEFIIVLRLNVALPAAAMSFFKSHTSLALMRFRRFSQVVPKKNCSAAVCTMRTRIRFRRSDAARCSIPQTVA